MKGYILLIDDNNFDLKTASRVIDSEGYIPAAFTSYHQATEWLKTETPLMILLDLVMPDISGFELIKILKQNPSLSECPITILSGKNEMADVKKALVLGAIDYVVKPIDPLILQEKIQRCLSKSNSTIAEVPLDNTAVSRVDIAKPAHIQSVSEFGLTLISDDNYSKNQIISLINVDAEIFGTKQLELSVYSCSQTDGKFLLKATYAGLTSAQRQSLRNAIRKFWIKIRKESA